MDKLFLVIVCCVGVMLLSGCVRQDVCPSDYIVQKEDRVRCYQEHTVYSSLSASNVLMGGIVCDGLVSDVNCVPQKSLKEVNCPNACINSYESSVGVVK